MGLHSYGRPAVHIYPGDKCGVRVGSYCSIAEDVDFVPGGMHNLGWASTFPLAERLGVLGGNPNPIELRDIEVGSDVWICRGARVLSEVAIGHGAVVGAYAVVASDVRSYAVVAGNPAREIRRRFTDDVIDLLLELSWWDWPPQRVLEHATLLNGPSGARLEAELRAARAPSATSRVRGDDPDKVRTDRSESA